MARIKIGDITIDGDQISIGGDPVYSQTTVQTQVVNAWGQGNVVNKVSTTSLQRPSPMGIQTPAFGIETSQNLMNRPPQTGLQKRANDPYMWVVGGAAVGVMASALFYFMSIASMFPIAIAGFICFVIGLTRYFQDKNNKKLLASQQEQESRVYAKTLRNLIKEPKPEQTIEWIVSKTGWTEATVVKTLAWLNKQGILQEEVDLQSGDWYYYIPSHERLAMEDDLASRMKRLEQGMSGGIRE